MLLKTENHTQPGKRLLQLTCCAVVTEQLLKRFRLKQNDKYSVNLRPEKCTGARDQIADVKEANKPGFFARLSANSVPTARPPTEHRRPSPVREAGVLCLQYSDFA